MTVREGEVTFTAYLDRSSIEVLATGGQVSVTDLIGGGGRDGPCSRTAALAVPKRGGGRRRGGEGGGGGAAQCL